jgi:4-aminobutyrate--pyruvate transaminase
LANPRLAPTAARLYAELGFYNIFFHRTSEAVAELAETLVDLTRMAGGKAYSATLVSEANETGQASLDLPRGPRQADQAQNQRARDRAFHGSPSAAASMRGLPFMQREFGLPLSGFLHRACPIPTAVCRGPQPRTATERG